MKIAFIFLFCAFTSTEANSQQGKTVYPPALRGRWELVFIQHNGREVTDMYLEKRPGIQFDSSRQSAGGSTGCNRFSGPFYASGNSLHFNFAQLTLTRMACRGEGEGIFLEALRKVNQFKAQNDTLVFSNNDTILMKWKKKP